MEFDTTYDAEFLKISELKWFPVVGMNYRKSAVKLLIIGESHYASENAESDKWNDVNCTRECINESQDKHAWENVTYNNIVKLMTGMKYPTSQLLWENVAYYNLIQTLLSSRTCRPKNEDWIKGVEIVKSIIEILVPDVCLFIGVSSKNYLVDSPEKIKKFPPISSTYPITLKIETEKRSTECLLIRHTGSGFSLSKWRDFIKQNEKVNDLCRTMEDLNKDSLSQEKKDYLFKNTFKKQLNEICNEFAWILGEVSIGEYEGTEFFSFSIVDSNLKIAFSFWEKGYKRLTAGIYNAKGGNFCYQITKKDKGCKQNAWWIYYEFYQAYSWKDREFEFIENGIMKSYIKEAVQSIWNFGKEKRLF